MLGLKHAVNFLAEYDPAWSLAFEDERRRLDHALGDIACGIEHYGSTSIAGLPAKPIIDVLIGVAQLDDRKPRAKSWAKIALPAR